MSQLLVSTVAMTLVCILSFVWPVWSQTGEADFLARWLNPNPPCNGQPAVCSGLGTNTLFLGQGSPSRVMFQGSRFSFPFPFADRPFAYARFEFCNGATNFGTVPDSVQFINELRGVLFGVPFDRSFGDRMFTITTINLPDADPVTNADFVYFGLHPDKLFGVLEGACAIIQVTMRVGLINTNTNRAQVLDTTSIEEMANQRITGTQVQDVETDTPEFIFEFTGFGQVLTPDTGVLFDGATRILGIDIQPESTTNPVNPKSDGIIPVAILTTEIFDATTIDPLSVLLGPNGAMETHGQGHIEDVDGDGADDMVLHFHTQETGIQCGDTEADFTGMTTDGQEIAGSDSIQTVGCK